MTTKHEIPNAESFMNRDVHCVTSDLSLMNVTRDLRRHNVSCAPVVDADESGKKTLIGFVTEADCLEKLSNELFHGSPHGSQTVATFMKRHPICVGPETDVFALVSIFASHGLRHIPVVDTENHLLGLVSRRDILAALDRFEDQTDHDFQLEKFPPDLRQITNLRFIAG